MFKGKVVKKGKVVFFKERNSNIIFNFLSDALEARCNLGLVGCTLGLVRCTLGLDR